MTTVIEAVFQNGVFKPLVEADFKENRRYKLIVEEMTPEIADQQQTEELRGGLQTFAEDWESDEMGVYDDYDAAKSRL